MTHSKQTLTINNHRLKKKKIVYISFTLFLFSFINKQLKLWKWKTTVQRKKYSNILTSEMYGLKTSASKKKNHKKNMIVGCIIFFYPCISIFTFEIYFTIFISCYYRYLRLEYLTIIIFIVIYFSLI